MYASRTIEGSAREPSAAAAAERAAAGRAAFPTPDAAPASLTAVLAAQRRAWTADMMPTAATRLDRLARLLALTDDHADEIAQAISADFGHRSKHVTWMADVMVVRGAILHARRRLRRWMKARRVATDPAYWPGSSRVQPQPLGVVGIVGPWNYPYQLSMGPAVSALAAGNRVMVKPSDATPRFAELLRRTVRERFAPEEMAVVTGDAEVARAFVALPFDHLLFTGSTAVGREVALAAAAHLTPVTLELGGKSPAILNADCDLAQAVPRIMAAKLVNTGQTCIAPDYLLVHESLIDRLGEAMRDATLRLYPTLADNPDYSSIAGPRHLARLQHLLDDARSRGANVMALHTETTARDGKLPPFALFGADEEMKVMQEEIFGPLLPVLSYSRLDEAIAYVNAHDRPLALYWFGRNRADLDAVLNRTVSGGVTVNDCFWHVMQNALPFGGVGASGQGCYHGEHGFRTFSHVKPVFLQSAHTGVGRMSPPYGRAFDLLARWLRLIA